MPEKFIVFILQTFPSYCNVSVCFWETDRSCGCAWYALTCNFYKLLREKIDILYEILYTAPIQKIKFHLNVKCHCCVVQALKISSFEGFKQYHFYLCTVHDPCIIFKYSVRAIILDNVIKPRGYREPTCILRGYVYLCYFTVCGGSKLNNGKSVLTSL